MKKVLVEKCTPQQAREEIKTQLKPANKPKVKANKVTIPSDTENTHYEYRYF
jgi:protein involved in polysaccharide export with SLBB domain